jgi:hypothetical protein
VPEPGNPQSLNRYSYALNNPMRYSDPSGHDPLDQVWQDEFKKLHRQRTPTPEDILIRLFSLAFPYNYSWETFYNDDGTYKEGNLQKILVDNGPANWSWTDMPEALSNLATWYKRGEELQFARDVGSLFGGLPNRFETPSAIVAFSNKNNPIRTWVNISQGDMPGNLTGNSDSDNNVHHWAWAYTMGASIGPFASVISIVREGIQYSGDRYNTFSDISIGGLGVDMAMWVLLNGVDKLAHNIR